MKILTLIVWGPLALAQTVPESVVRITKVDHGQVQFQNTGNKPIAGIVVRNIAPPQDQGDVLLSVYGDDGVLPGTSGNIAGWQNSDMANTEIAAVVFEDGMTMGSAVDHANMDKDEVDAIFEIRRGEADEWAKWKSEVDNLGSDPHQAIARFLADVKAIPQSGGALQTADDVRNRYVIGGRDSARATLRDDADNIRQVLALGERGEDWVFKNLVLDRVHRRSQTYSQATRREGQ